MKLFVSPLSKLAETARASGAGWLISLASPDADNSASRELSLRERLDLRFNDIAEPRNGLVAPTENDVAQIIRFADRWDGSTPLLVNCYAGISRSTAAAYIIACAKCPASNEQELANTLRKLSPSATPNPLLIEHADGMLGRETRMIQAIERIGRGRDAFEGEAFEWNL